MENQLVFCKKHLKNAKDPFFFDYFDVFTVFLSRRRGVDAMEASFEEILG